MSSETVNKPAVVEMADVPPVAVTPVTPLTVVISRALSLLIDTPPSPALAANLSTLVLSVVAPPMPFVAVATKFGAETRPPPPSIAVLVSSLTIVPALTVPSTVIFPVPLTSTTESPVTVGSWVPTLGVPFAATFPSVTSPVAERYTLLLPAVILTRPGT